MSLYARDMKPGMVYRRNYKEGLCTAWRICLDRRIVGSTVHITFFNLHGKIHRWAYGQWSLLEVME